MRNSAGLTSDVIDVIRKHAFLNAVKYGGKAKVEAVIGKVLHERPDLREQLELLIENVKKIVEEVNAIPLHEQKRIVDEKWPEAMEKPPSKKELPPLPYAKRYETIVTRFSPNPDCVLHLGNARALILSHEYSEMYKGKFILRFEDTDPKTKKPEIEFYDAIREDMLWLGCKWHEEYVQSKRMSIYYKYAKDMVEKGYAYVCTCNREVFRRMVIEGRPCPCREADVSDQASRLEKMLNGEYEEGKAVVRIKTDLAHPNPAVREWPALRVIDPKKNPHPLVEDEFFVWPLYNFACGLDDHLMGITHIIRGKEHIVNEIRQRFIYRYYGWRYPETIHIGRLKIRNAVLSKSKIKEGVKNRLYSGYDDPRLPTLQALRNRGILPETIRKFMIDIGIKPADITIEWENLYAYNRKIVDPISNRYFFVENPLKLRVRGLEKRYEVKLPLHPDFPERGTRTFVIEPVEGSAYFLISRKDVDILRKASAIRLMGAFNIKPHVLSEEVAEASFLSESVLEARKEKYPIIHWIPIGTGIEASIVMPDGSILKGIAEDSTSKLKPGELIQFERFGFVRVKEIKPFLAYFTHT